VEDVPLIRAYLIGLLPRFGSGSYGGVLPNVLRSRFSVKNRGARAVFFSKTAPPPPEKACQTPPYIGNKTKDTNQ